MGREGVRRRGAPDTGDAGGVTRLLTVVVLRVDVAGTLAQCQRQQQEGTETPREPHPPSALSFYCHARHISRKRVGERSFRGALAFGG